MSASWDNRAPAEALMTFYTRKHRSLAKYRLEMKRRLIPSYYSLFRTVPPSLVFLKT